MSSVRLLAAIMFTDIEGYTAMMEKSEDIALANVKLHEKSLERLVKNHNGELVQFYGDGSLSIFTSAVEAVKCARDLQLSFSNEVPVRIGLHIGEILQDEGKTYGDAVNVASRVESLGVAGSVLVSQSLFEKVKNQSGFDFHPLGSFGLKNVTNPMPVYALVHEGLMVPNRKEILNKGARGRSMPIFWTWGIITLALALISGIYWSQSTKTSEPDPLSYISSIAILPFEDLSTQQDQTYLGFGIAAEIINLLSQIPQLKVIGRTSSFSIYEREKNLVNIANELQVNYLLEGDIQRREEQLKINVRLIDASSGTTLWNHTTPFIDLDIIHRIQEEIALQIGHELRFSVQEHALNSYNTSNIQAYLLYLKHLYLLSTDAFNSQEEMRRLRNEAYALDSTFLPVVFTQAMWNENEELAEVYLNKMRQIDSTSPYTMAASAVYQMNVVKDFNAAAAEFKSAVRLDNQLDASTLAFCGWNLGLLSPPQGGDSHL